MSNLVHWKMDAQIKWVTVGATGGVNFFARPELRASLLFLGVNRRDPISSEGMATSKVFALEGASSGHYRVDAYLAPALTEHVATGVQFLVLEGIRCLGVGVITDPGGPTVEG
jgi:hypothetical protein